MNNKKTADDSYNINLIHSKDVDWDNNIFFTRPNSSLVAEFRMKNDSTFLKYKLVGAPDTARFANKTDVVFIKYKDGQRFNFYMKVVEEVDKHTNKPLIDDVHYKIIPANFNGVIYYISLDHQFLNGYQYKNGMVSGVVSISKITQPQVQTLSNDNKKNLLVQVCTTYQIIETVCSQGFTQDANGNWQSSGPPHDCYDHVVGTTQVCETDNSGGGPGGAAGDSGGSGGGGGTTPTPTNPCGVSGASVNVIAVNSVKVAYVNPADGGGAGTNNPPPCSTVRNQVIRIDSLKAKYPCKVKLILNKLLDISIYQNFTSPFNTNIKPDLTWDSNALPWNQNNGNNQFTYQLGVTETTNRSATISLNSFMLQNSSQLLIASAAIHETLHAVINYNIQTASGNYTNPTNVNDTWFNALTSWYTINSLPSNFRDHYEMLDYYFAQSVSILSAWDNNANDMKNYQMIMLYGLDNATDGNTSQKQILQAEYQRLLNKYNITANDLDVYWKTQLNSSNAKLPTSGCN